MRTMIALVFVALMGMSASAVGQTQTTDPAAPVVSTETSTTQAEPSASGSGPDHSVAPPQDAHADAPANMTDSTAAGPTAQQVQAAQQFYQSLHRQTGSVLVAGGKVRLQIPATHYFLGAEDARRVLVDQWGNPPSAADGVEGMIFPDGANPAMGAWGAVVEYRPDGYVSDEDASSTNYTDLLHQMQEQTNAANAERQRQGYPAMTLVGWAEPPHYDAATHKVYWARELAFADSHLHTLNYDIRVLGRGGVLSVSFIAGMDELPQIRSAAPAVMAIPEFTPGNRYADYQSGTDPRAAYGIAGLIAGGAIAAVAQKTGLLAIILLAAKKFIVLILAGLAAIGGAIRRMFSGRKRDEGPPVA
ncbi:MAG: DUF2167 domain-containing protein [Proteobacteria bacterium]|nr:DUF2167 domain-containing protein [Pseudomonadota bacterium]